MGVSKILLKKIPLGEKIIIYTSRPSLIVGSKGSNIKDLTKALKRDFKLENPQIEINEVKNIFLDAHIVAERIASTLERFGSARFKGVGHKVMGNVVNSGALGVEVLISGKIPGSRAKNWRFYQGYLKKCGDIAVSGVRKAQTTALLKSGIIGIKVSIMPPDLELPDNIEILDEPVQITEEVEVSEKETKKGKKKPAKKKTTYKKEKKTGSDAVEKAEVKKEVSEEVTEVKEEATEEVKGDKEEPKQAPEKEETPVLKDESTSEELKDENNATSSEKSEEVKEE